jgi:hypothetical protein
MSGNHSIIRRRLGHINQMVDAYDSTGDEDSRLMRATSTVWQSSVNQRTGNGVARAMGRAKNAERNKRRGSTVPGLLDDSPLRRCDSWRRRPVLVSDGGLQFHAIGDSSLAGFDERDRLTE